jgi:16S rRNA C967 or C1407 C5-methylase (RsmB/RsmF family)
MNEKLEKRIQKMEQKLNPKPKGTFDIVKHIREIRIEVERLMQLSQTEYEMEIEQPPKTTAEKVARISAADQKRFLALSPEEKQRYLGYPTSHFTPDEFARIQESQDLIKKNPDNWVTNHLNKIHSRKP